MKKSLLFISMIVMLTAVAAFANVSSVFAKTVDPGSDPVGCVAFGGTWVQTGDNTWNCEFSPDHFYSRLYCPAGYGVIDSFEFDGTSWLWVNWVCKTGYSTTSRFTRPWWLGSDS